MQRTALEGFGMLAVLLCLVVTIRPVLRRRHDAPDKVAYVTAPAEKPLVRLLKESEDLEAAVRRAAQFERRMAVLLEQRASRYESFIARQATVTNITVSKARQASEFSPDDLDSA